MVLGTWKERLKTSSKMRGWNTWNSYASTIDSALILESAQAIVDSGLAKVGYEYVNIDDTWQASSRMDNGTLGWDATKCEHAWAPCELRC